MLSFIKNYFFPHKDNSFVPKVFKRKSFIFTSSFILLLFTISLAGSKIAQSDLFSIKSPVIIQAPISSVEQQSVLSVKNIYAEHLTASSYKQGILEDFANIQSKNVNLIYFILLLVIYVIFFIMALVQIRERHSPRHIASAVFLIVFITILFYLNSKLIL